MEPTMPNDEEARPVTAGHPDGEHQPPQLSVLANHMADDEVQALMLETGQIATWQTYVSQTIDF